MKLSLLVCLVLTLAGAGRAVPPAEVALTGDWEVRITVPGPNPVAGTVRVTPPSWMTVTAEKHEALPVFNPQAGGWLKGAKLRRLIAQETTTPNLLDPASLVLRAGAEPESAIYRAGADYEADLAWGTIGRATNSAIPQGQPVFASYRYMPLRLDAIVLTADGRIVLRPGEPRSSAPLPPEIRPDERRLAHVWLPGPMSKLGPDHLFPILETAYPEPAKTRPSPAERVLPRTLQKLEAGEPVRILAWGDSVTDGSYLPFPAREQWQEQFVARLRQRYPRSPIELVTEAWGGRNTAIYLAEPPGSPHNYQEKVLGAKPDLVVSEFVNDAGLDPRQVEERYGKLLADFQGIGAEWIVLTPHYVRMDWMHLTREREVDDDPRPYVAGLRAFAAAHPVALADASLRYGRLWRQGLPHSTLLLNAINHPDARGMKLFADALLALFPDEEAARSQHGIWHDADRKRVTLSDARGDLVLRLSYDGGCYLDRVMVRGREVAGAGGVGSAIQVAGKQFTTRAGIPTPEVTAARDELTVSNILFGGGGLQVQETWRFSLKSDRILWRIQRQHLGGGVLDDTGFPVWEFKDMTTWTGGLLSQGGVIWNKYLETPNATFGTGADAVTFWNRGFGDCLRVAAAVPLDRRMSLRFSHQPGQAFTFNCVVSEGDLAPKHNLRRFLHDRQDVWKPFPVAAGGTTVELELQALDYDQAYSRGVFPGLNERSIREVLHTIARYGVIDRKLVGGNGWRTGWVCLHEPWFAQFGLALADPGYTRNFADALDYERDHAIHPDGRVKSRWHHTPEDAQPGTYEPTGFYEAQWGLLLDSQPSYVINVAEQFDLTGDRAWLRGQKDACERALDYLLKRDADGDGLVEMMTGSHAEKRGSDWIDVIWAAHENGLVNAELFYALKLWADAEELLGDAPRAQAYREAAARLKTRFNQPTSEGGLWDPTNQWYVYWRDKDDSIHGNNLVVPVNFAAIGYGLCDDPARSGAILDKVEAWTEKEQLFFWPISFLPYEKDDGHPLNFPFPKYENGDLFLSWGELGLRAYSRYRPDLAVKYAKKVLARYEADGLSFQRYLRQTQAGSGDDILSGNCSAVVGLYRDIYGIQPRHDRLQLDPHLTPELNGTRVRYGLRGRRYDVDLSMDDYRVSAEGVSVRSARPFGVNLEAGAVAFFPGTSAPAGLTVARPSSGGLEITVDSWPAQGSEPRRWAERGTSAGKLRHLLSGLQPGGRYQLSVEGRPKKTLKADKAGRIEFEAAPQRFEVSLK